MSKIKSVIRDLSNQSDEKLHEQLFSCKKELFNLRFQQTLGELKNTSKFRQVKTNIARIKTEVAHRLKLGV